MAVEAQKIRAILAATQGIDWSVLPWGNRRHPARRRSRHRRGTRFLRANGVDLILGGRCVLGGSARAESAPRSSCENSPAAMGHEDRLARL